MFARGPDALCPWSTLLAITGRQNSKTLVRFPWLVSNGNWLTLRNLVKVSSSTWNSDKYCAAAAHSGDIRGKGIASRWIAYMYIGWHGFFCQFRGGINTLIFSLHSMASFRECFRTSRPCCTYLGSDTAGLSKFRCSDKGSMGDLDPARLARP